MKSRQEYVGELGEKIAASHYSREGCIVEWALNPFDRIKDMIVDGKKKEVKCQTLYCVRDCFSLKLNQMKKCKNGFLLIECPTTYSPIARMYEVEKGFRFGQSVRNNGDVRYDIPRKQPALKLIREIVGEEYNMLKAYAKDYVRAKRLPKSN